MTTAMVLAEACAECDELRAKVEADRKRYGAARLGLHCDACGATVYAGRKPAAAPAAPRAPSEGELAQRAARAQQRTLEDMACVARFRRHASGRSFSHTLARNIHDKAATDPGDAKRARLAPPLTDADREADLARGRRLDGVLRRLVSDARAARRRDRPALELLRVLASLAAWVNGDRPMPAPLPPDWLGAPDVVRAVAVLDYLAERAGDGRTYAYSSKGEARAVATWPELVGAAFMRGKHASKSDAALAHANHGAPLLAAAVAVWVAARQNAGR